MLPSAVPIDLVGALLGRETAGRAIFAYGFAKRRRSNLVPNESRDYRLLVTKYLALDDEPFSAMLMDDDIVEVNCGEQTVQE